MKKELIIVTLLIILTIPAVQQLFIPGAYTSHDLTHHIIRQIAMDKILSDGQFPPRWSDYLNHGYGYPVFMFNYPLPAMIGQLFHLSGLDYINSVKAIFILSMFLTPLTMYLFLRELISNRLAAMLGAIFYLYAPVHFVITYVSAAVGSAVAYWIIPLVLWSIVRYKHRPSLFSLYVGIVSFACLILAHNVTTLMFAPLILGFIGLQAFTSTDKLKLFWQLTLIPLLGSLLTAFFWLPALAQKSILRYDLVLNRYYADHFPSLQQLIYSPWGYGLSHPSVDQDGFSFQIGLIHLLVIGILIAGLYIYRRDKNFKWLTTFCLTFFVISVLVMLPISLPLWDNLPLLELVQFPFRFLMLSVFCAAIAAALLIKYLPLPKVLFAILLILVIYANRNHWRINQVFDPGLPYYLSSQPTTAMAGEHFPLWVTQEATVSATTKITPLDTIQYQTISDRTTSYQASLIAETSGQIQFNQIYFPGWQYQLDQTSITPHSLTLDTGLPIFNIPTGQHIFTAKLTDTPIVKAGNWLSLLTVFGLISWAIYRRFSLKKRSI